MKNNANTSWIKVLGLISSLSLLSLSQAAMAGDGLPARFVSSLTCTVRPYTSNVLNPFGKNLMFKAHIEISDADQTVVMNWQRLTGPSGTAVYKIVADAHSATYRPEERSTLATFVSGSLPFTKGEALEAPTQMQIWAPLSEELVVRKPSLIFGGQILGSGGACLDAEID